MAENGDRTREALLDAAEELFALHGVDAVSNRRITEHVGAANHSAVAYHFGSREQFLRALAARDSNTIAARRAEMVAALPADAGLHDLLACLILPWTGHLGSLPVPSWRARCLNQLRTVPSVRSALREGARQPMVDDLVQRIWAALPELPRPVLYGRSWAFGYMVLGVCAEYEEQIQTGEGPPAWNGPGRFLIDCGAGMLAAPVTGSGGFLTRPAPLLLP